MFEKLIKMDKQSVTIFICFGILSLGFVVAGSKPNNANIGKNDGSLNFNFHFNKITHFRLNFEWSSHIEWLYSDASVVSSFSDFGKFGLVL